MTIWSSSFYIYCIFNYFSLNLSLLINFKLHFPFKNLAKAEGGTYFYERKKNLSNPSLQLVEKILNIVFSIFKQFMRQALLTDYLPKKTIHNTIVDQWATQRKRGIPNMQYEGQPFLIKQHRCSSACLEFKAVFCSNNSIEQNFQLREGLPLDQCAKLLHQLVTDNIKKKKMLQKKKKIIKRLNKKKVKRSANLTNKQRQEILRLQEKGFSNSIIASQLNVTIGQVRMNKKMCQQGKCKEEIILSENQKKYLVQQCSASSNTNLFNVDLLYRDFKEHFTDQQFSKNQFRQLLPTLKIKYKVPSLKPLQYFSKGNRNQQVLKFISEICAYISYNYKLIFVDECSLGTISRQTYKQWHVNGSFKQQIGRVGFHQVLISALGEDDFIFYQVIQGTGRSFIFKNFISHLMIAAKSHYQNQQFVIILDNAPIHTSDEMEQILEKIPHVFTPPYRSDMNSIEHLFSYLKREIVKEQPFINLRFHSVLHQVLQKTNPSTINNWCYCIYGRMLEEVQYLL